MYNSINKHRSKCKVFQNYKKQISEVNYPLAGTDFLLFTDLDLNTLFEKIKQEFPKSIPQMIQSDCQMEDLFRILALKVPDIE